MLLKVAGMTVGECSHLSVSAIRGSSVSLQAGLMRMEILMSDVSPNVYYVLRVLVQHKAASAILLARWSAALGSLLKKPGVSVQVDDGDETLTMEEASCMGPIEIPSRAEGNAGLARNMEFAFISAKQPQ